ncbi:hypothetical protein A2U01_0117520, partial [Trifolium medium]|nr:hypothetical protein [Trifolium medium]
MSALAHAEPSMLGRGGVIAIRHIHTRLSAQVHP